MNENEQDAAWLVVILAMAGVGVAWRGQNLTLAVISAVLGLGGLVAVALASRTRQTRYAKARAAALAAHPARNAPGRSRHTHPIAP